MATLTELTGYKIMLVKLLKKEMSPDLVEETEPIILNQNPGGSTSDASNDKKGDDGKRERAKKDEQFIPKGAIIRRGQVYIYEAD